MDILWWLAPAGATTLLAIGWVVWMGREGHGARDREESVARLARALEHEHPGPRRGTTGTAEPSRSRDRSTGIAVRPLRQVLPQEPASRPDGPGSKA